VSQDITRKIYLAFHELSQRNTRQRRLIAQHLVEFARSGVDFTTDDLWQTLRQGDAHVGRATVFRSVEKLVEVGLLERVEFADGSHHYRICDGGHHHHLTCTQCHKVVDIDLCLPVEQLAAVGDQNDFAIEGHSLTLFGRCSECRS
jgi:Fur family transcriptional regulator, ferric uptake regulator